MTTVADFAVVTSGNVLYEISASAPLEGAQSLHIYGNGTDNVWRLCLAHQTKDPSGVTHGRLRYLFKQDNVGNTRGGIFFRATTHDLVGTTGSAYVYSLEQNSSLSTRDRLYKTTGGISNLSLLTFYNDGAPLENQAYAIEIRWYESALLFGGLLIEVWRTNGGDTNFDNMTFRFSHLDASPLTSVTTWGLWYEAIGGGATTDAWYDAWEVDKTTPPTSPSMLRFERFIPASSPGAIRLRPPGQGVTPVGALSGRYSLELTGVNATYKELAFMSDPVLFPGALTEGQLVCRLGPLAGSSTAYGGFVLLPSLRDVRSGSGAQCYTVGLHYNVGTGFFGVGVRKETNGLGSGSVLNSANVGLPNGVALWLEILWQAAAPASRFDIYSGTAANFSDRSLSLSVTDNPGYQVAAGMGFFVLYGAAEMACLFDQLTLRPFPGF